MAEDGSLPYRRSLLAGAVQPPWLDELAAYVAHELNQPLAIIGLSAENALRDLGHGEAEAALRQLQEGIVVQVRHANGTIEMLRRSARGGQPSAPPAPVPLEELATCLAHELNPPLGIIGLFASSAMIHLRRGEAEGAVRQLEGIVVQVHRAVGIIEKLGRFARGGQSGAPPAPMPLDEAVANAPPPAGRGRRKQRSRLRRR